MKKHTVARGRGLTAALLFAALILSLFAGCAAKPGSETPAASAPADSIRQYYERRAAADAEHDYSRMSLETLDAMSTGTASAAVDTDGLRVELTGAVRSGESAEHVRHVNQLTARLLDRLTEVSSAYRLTPAQCVTISAAAALHDVGKIGVDQSILNKPGRLTPEEFEAVKLHTVIGEELLRGMREYRGEELLETAAEICRWHHERYDGGGYPDGLRGDDIPIAAQVVSLADVYDALVSRRAYKEAYTPERAMEMIHEGQCGAFNPLLVQCLTDIQDALRTEVYAGGPAS